MDTNAENLLPFSIRAVYLRNSSVNIAEGFDPTMPGQPLAAKFRTGDGKVECRETELDNNGEKQVIRSCTFTTRFEFAYTRPLDNPAPQVDEDFGKSLLAQIAADISVDYLYNLPEFPPDQQSLQKWASANVILHAWPYWREYCHSTLSRMNFPVTLIPLIQFSQMNPESESEDIE